jgi:hypothetical protein
MGLVKKRKNKNATPEQQNSQVTAQPLSGDTSPINISKQEETEIPQPAKDFAQKFKDNFKDGRTLNWFIGEFIGFKCIPLLFYIFHIGLNIYWLITYYTKGDSWYFRCILAFWLISAGSATLRSFLFYNPGWPKKKIEAHYLTPEIIYQKRNLISAGK